MWELGRAYERAQIADAIEQARAVPARLPRPRPWEEQVAARRAVFDQCYAEAQQLRREREAAASPPPEP